MQDAVDCYDSDVLDTFWYALNRNVEYTKETHPVYARILRREILRAHIRKQSNVQTTMIPQVHELMLKCVAEDKKHGIQIPQQWCDSEVVEEVRKCAADMPAQLSKYFAVLCEPKLNINPPICKRMCKLYRVMDNIPLANDIAAFLIDVNCGKLDREEHKYLCALFIVNNNRKLLVLDLLTVHKFSAEEMLGMQQFADNDTIALLVRSGAVRQTGAAAM